MSKDLTQLFRFDVTQESDFLTLANAFAHAMKAVEKQGYAVEYNGETLLHPGQIGIRGISGIGKSTFFDTVMHAFAEPEPATVTQKHQPSGDLSRNVQVWKHWDMKTLGKQVIIEDSHARAALIGYPAMSPPERTRPGVTVYEHIEENNGFCDAMLKMDYDDQGRRIAEVRVTEEVALDDDFSSGFIPRVRDISL